MMCLEMMNRKRASELNDVFRQQFFDNVRVLLEVGILHFVSGSPHSAV